MTLVRLPRNAQQIGEIRVVVYIDDNPASEPTAVTFGVEGFGDTEAIGYLTVVLDRLREQRRFAWNTCPECGKTWEEHDHDFDHVEDDDLDEEEGE